MDKNKQTIIFPIKNDLELFEDELSRIINANENFLKNHLYNFMFSKPKRLRPVFVFLFSKILNIKNELVLKIALALEIFHSASLIHDDIIDEDELRRNYPTFYKKFGSKIAVLEGDLLLAEGLMVLSSASLDILKIFSKNISATIQGEINQNENKNKITDEKTYIKKTLDKTGNLFLAGLEALFTLGDFDDNLKNNLINFLKNYTIAFQIKNDIENITSNSSDIKNGNYTLPVIYSFMENRKEILNSDLEEKYIEKSRQKVKDLEADALSYLNSIDESEYKKSLIELCKYTLRS